MGRVAPHKRPDALVRAVALVRRRGRPGARLTLVGQPLTPGFAEAVAGLGAELLGDGFRLRSGLPAEELAETYRGADAFLCLSEHEGFCVPLLEAFHFGLPVVARGVAAVPEVAHDAAVLLGPEDDEAVAAEALALVLGDPDLRAGLTARGRARLGAYAPERGAEALRAAIEAAAA